MRRRLSKTKNKDDKVSTPQSNASPGTLTVEKLLNINGQQPPEQPEKVSDDTIIIT